MRSQIFAERQIQYFFNYHVFYFILYYIILSFFCLFIYLFILPQIDPGKKISPPPPRQGSLRPFAVSFAGCDLLGDSRVLSIVSIMAAPKILCEGTARIYKGDEQPEKEMAILDRSRR